MRRADLITDLTDVEPALAVNKLIPMLTHFWLTRRELLAYNDQIAMSVPFKTEFEGAVQRSLLDLLKAGDPSGEDDVELSERDRKLVVKSDRHTFRLDLLDPNFVFKMPKPQHTAVDGKVMARVIKKMEHCLPSIGTDTSAVEKIGLTIDPEPNRLALYSTDGGVLSRAYARFGETPMDLPRATLPRAFCEQMLRAYRMLPEDERGSVRLEIAKRLVRIGDQEVPDHYALFVAGRIALYGRLLQTRDPLNFPDAVGYHLRPDDLQYLVKVPRQLAAALDRASIVCDEKRRHTKLTVEAGRLHLLSRSDTEEVRDEIPYPSNQERLEISVHPKLLRRGASFDHMLISPSCVAMTKGKDKQGRPRKDGDLYVVSLRA